jgi:hypothetical protein
MTTTVIWTDEEVEQWWLQFGVALFFLIPLDLLTTLLAVTKYGTAVEANPIMRWLLSRGLLLVGVVNVVVVCLVIGLFHLALVGMRRAPASRRSSLTHVVNVWLGVLLVTGVALVTNNLLAVV